MSTLIQKLRAPRVFAIAIFDVFAALSIPLLLTLYYHWKSSTFLYSGAAALVLGEIVHLLLGIDTLVTKLLYDINVL